MDDRKKKILQAIVEEYIETAEPVSSKALVEKHGIDYSSATIRNDMAELEKIGLLDKPHTSAGRIPSAQGYRYYVDELLNYNDISMQEIKYIQTQLATKVNQIEDAGSMEEAVNKAYRLAQKGDTVLLSPCCASFDLFTCYEDRGDQFKACVRNL